jgi:hypothetical protein
VGRSPTAKLVAGVPNDPVTVPKSIETLLESALATARSKKFCSTSTFSIVQVCGSPIVISPSHSSEKLVQINKFPLIPDDTFLPASNP